MRAIAYRPLRTNILLGESALHVQSCAPPQDLAEHVTEFWQYDVRDSEPWVPVQIYPSGMAVLRFDIAAAHVDASLFGPSLSPHMRGLFYRHVSVFGVALHATRTASLLGAAASEIRDLRVQLEVFWPKALPQLENKLWQAQTFAARVQILSDFLRRVLRPELPNAAFLRAFRALVQRGGVMPVHDARGAVASERTLRRQFARHVGLSPKQMARVLRFQALLRALVPGGQSHSAPNFARLALNTGFADQAHMIREFAQLVGVSPGKFLSDLPRLHDLRLAIWKNLRPEDPPRPQPAIRRLG